MLSLVEIPSFVKKYADGSQSLSHPVAILIITS